MAGSMTLLGVGAAGSGAAASTYATEVLADAPKGYWRLGESAGTNAVDASGNAHDGTYTGTYTLGVAGVVSGNTAVDFLGTGYVNIPNHADFGITGAITLEAWVKPVDRADYYFIVAKDAGGTGRPFEFRLEQTTGKPTVLPWNVAANTAVPTGSWSHVAVSRSGANATFYLNGVADGTPGGIGDGTNGSNDVKIGSRDDLFSKFKGAIDEVAIYNTALSGARIAAHYAAA